MRTAAVATLLGLCARPGDGAANATYVVGPEGVDYAEADFFCTQIGAALATIADAAENELARQACANPYAAFDCWLGLVKGGSWFWHDGTAAAYTNWAAGQPQYQANAVMSMLGEWYDESADPDEWRTTSGQPHPLCRVVGDLNFTTNVHHPQQCQMRCGSDPDEDCCAAKSWMSCADDAGGGKYQLVRTDDVCGDVDGGRVSYSFHCFPCKPGQTCDNGRGDDEKKCESGLGKCGGGCVAAIIIFFVILPLCCIAASVAACVFACAQNQAGRAPVRPQPVAYGRPTGGAVQMQQYGKPAPYGQAAPYGQQPVQPMVVQPMAMQPVQPMVVQPMVVQPQVVQGAVVTGTVVGQPAYAPQREY